MPRHLHRVEPEVLAELGEGDDQTKDIEELTTKIEAAGMPDSVKKEALRELDRLAKMPVAAGEYTVSRTYLDWLIALPWNKRTEERIDLPHTKRILDAAGARVDVAFDWEEAAAGASVFIKGDSSGVPQETRASIERTRVALKGPLETPVGFGEKSANVTLRKLFETFANVRPVRELPGVPTPSNNALTLPGVAVGACSVRGSATFGK
mgnify:CR=1 FL=1